MPLYEYYPYDKHIPDSYKTLEDEQKILDLWAEHEKNPVTEEDYYETKEGTFSLISGPPFPTGSPHSGHILNAVLKDVFVRYGYQTFLEVKTNFHWDCHGLPVEHEVDKKLGIRNPGDIQKMGISAYNAECRKFLARHEAEWKNSFKRIGVRVDFSDSYRAMTAQSMERVWDVFKRLYDQGLVYRDTKVLPFSTGCFTHLSDFEADQKKGDVTELGVVIALNIEHSKEKLLVWVVGCWKLIATMAICVNPNGRYVKVKVLCNGNIYIVSKSRLSFTFPKTSEYTVLSEFDGKTLKDLNCSSPNVHSQECEVRLRVTVDESIPLDVGTGIVALSPYFADADFRICKENGIQFDENYCPVDDSGRFREYITEIGGMSVVEACVPIFDSLQRRGCLFHHEEIRSKGQYCWRSDTPLINKLVSTWFIRTKGQSEQIVENSVKVNWTFGRGEAAIKDCLEKFNDWPVGRSRYWGTPLPIWTSQSGDEVVCIGSIKELLELTGLESVSDLHRDCVDGLQIKSKTPGNPPLLRVSEVFDCWFEASIFPRDGDGENRNETNEVDVIIEGSDQFNGWFYTTTALSKALCLPPPSKNVLVHGLVETSKGEKISKRMHNHNDPLHMVDKYGADAVRLYLLATPLVSGCNCVLHEQDVPKMASRIFPYLYKIIKDIMPRFGKAGMISYGFFFSIESKYNIFDRWIMSRMERLSQLYENEMAAFRPENLVEKIAKHLEIVFDVYVPLRRGKFNENEEFVTAVLFDILVKTTVILSPFAPFFTEHVFQLIKPWATWFGKSLMYKTPLVRKANDLIVKNVEEKMDCWRLVVGLVRELRRVHLIPIQYRINELTLITPFEMLFKDNTLLNETLMHVTNVHRISITNDRSQFGVELTADLREDSSLREKLSPTEVEELSFLIQQLSDGEVEELIQNKSFTANGQEVPLDDIQISCKFNKELDKNQAITGRNGVAALIRMNKNLDYYEEGTRLELVNCVQKFKKKCKVYLSEKAVVGYSSKDECIRHAFEKYAVHLKKSTNVTVKPMDGIDVGKSKEGAIRMEVEIKGASVDLCLYKEEL